MVIIGAKGGLRLTMTSLSGLVLSQTQKVFSLGSDKFTNTNARESAGAFLYLRVTISIFNEARQVKICMCICESRWFFIYSLEQIADNSYIKVYEK